MNPCALSTAPHSVFEWLRRRACALEHSHGAYGLCQTGTSHATAATMWIFAFGLWMLFLGSTFLLIPALTGWPPFTRIQKIAKACGFPENAGIWSRFFGVAIASFGLFYFAAALFELRLFFWITVFGRLGIFGVCTYLSWRHTERSDRSGVARPHNLLWFATPDLASATITACVMLDDWLAGVIFVGGVALLTAAVGFLTFPSWIVELIGVDTKPGAWNAVLGALLAFFGAYGVVAAMLDLRPILWAAILSNTIILGMLFLDLLFDRTSAKSSFRLKGFVGVLFFVTACNLAWAIHHDIPAPTMTPG